MPDVAIDHAVGLSSSTGALVNSAAGNGIVVLCCSGSADDNVITGVKYGAVDLILMGWVQANDDGAGGVTMYGKIGGLPTGSNTVDVTGFRDWAGATTYVNADTFGDVVTKFYDTYADGSLTIPDTVDGGMVVTGSCGGSGDGTSPTATSPGTVEWFELANNGSGAGNGWCVDQASAGGGADTTVAWTYDPEDDWGAMIGVEVKPASGGGGSTSGSAALKSKKPHLVATSTEKSVTTAALKLKKPRLVVTSAEKAVTTAALKLKKPHLVVTSTEKNVVTAALRLKKPHLVAASAEKSSGSAALTSKKPVLLASSVAGDVIRWRDGGTPGLSTDTTISYTLPEDIVEGDLVIFYCTNYGVGSNSIAVGSDSPNAPTEGDQRFSGNGVSTLSWWQMRVAAEDVGATITFTQDSATYIGLVVGSWSGDAIITAFAVGDTAGSALSSWPAPTLTSDADDEWAVYIATGVGGGGDETVTYSGGTARVQDATTGLTMYDSNGSVGPSGTTVGGDDWLPPAGNESFYGYTLTLSQIPSETSTASGNFVSHKPVLLAASSEKAVGSAALRLKKPVLAVSSHEASSSSAAFRLKKPVLSAVSSEKSSVTAALRLKKPVLSAASAEKSAVTGAFRLHKPVLHVSSSETTLITGAFHLHKPRMVADSDKRADFSGAIILKKPVLSGTSQEKTVVTAALRLHKVRLSGTSHEKTVAHAAFTLHKVQLHGSSTNGERTAQADQLFIFSPI